MYPKWLHILLAVYPCISALGEVIPHNHTIYVVQEGWHTGIILETATIPDSIWHDKERYNDKKYLDIGWGDEAFYQEPSISIILAIRAVLIPTQSVIRIHAFQTHPELYYGSFASLFEVKLSNDQYNSLISFISNSFIRDKDGETILSPLHAGNRNFFLAKRKYHLFRTCNTWVCMALKESNVPFRSVGIVTRRQLARQFNRLDQKIVRKIH